MALPSSGSISLNQVNVELGNSGTANINMGSSAVRDLFGVASGAISLSDGYGASSVSWPTIDSTWSLEKESTGTLGSILDSTIAGNTVYWGNTAASVYATSNGQLTSLAKVVLPCTQAFVGKSSPPKLGATTGVFPTHMVLGLDNTQSSSQYSDCVVDYLSTAGVPMTWANAGQGVNLWVVDHVITNNSGDSFELLATGHGYYGISTWSAFNPTILANYQTTIKSKMSVSTSWRIYARARSVVA